MRKKFLKLYGLLIIYLIGREGCVCDFMLSKDRSLQSHLQSKFATNGPVIMHVMILLCATSSKGAVLVCSDST